MGDADLARPRPRPGGLIRVAVRAFAKELALLLLALAVSFTLWVIVSTEQNPAVIDVFPADLTVTPIGLSRDLEVFNQVSTVRVRVSAPRDAWNRLRASSFQATADLTGFGMGWQDVRVDVRSNDSQVKVVDVVPARVPIRLEAVVRRTIPARVNLVGTPSFGHIFKAPRTSLESVTAVGPAPLVRDVDAAVAELSLEGLKVSIDQSIALQPRDSRGKVVEGVRLEPGTVQVLVAIEQQIFFSTVPVHPVIVGNVAPGYWIESISADPSIVTLLGTRDVLQPVLFLQTKPVEVNGATQDVVRSVDLNLPAGASLAANQKVTIYAAVRPTPGTRLFLVAPMFQGLAPGLAAVAPSVSLNLAGPIPALQRLQPSDVRVVVDLTGLGPGRYDLAANVSTPTGVSLSANGSIRVPVEIRAEIPPTPTPKPAA